MTHLGVDLARNQQPRMYKTPQEKANSHHHHRRLHRFASFFAQIICPLGPLFALPSLTEKWMVKKSSEGLIVAVKSDPPLIIAAGAVTLALSCLSNLTILFRLIDTHCRVFTFATIALLISHVILSLVSCLIFGITNSGGENFILSTAFYLTVASAAVALAVALALIADGYQTEWYKSNGTGISSAQCSLVISFDLFVTWLIVGTCAFRYLLENVNFLDALYFSVQCLVTTGFGDIVPTSTAARIIMILYFIPGILSFAILVCFTRGVVLEALQDRFKEKERSILKSLKRRKAGEQPRTRDEKLVASTYEDAIVKLQKERNRDFRSQLLVSLLLVIVFWLLSALVYSKLEGWSYFVAFYFFFIASSTIGLGDYTPKTEGGRAFFCVFALLGTGVLTVFFSILADGYSSTFKETFQRNVLAKLIKSLKAKKAEHLDNDAEPNPTISTLAHIIHYRQEDEATAETNEKQEQSNPPVDERVELLRLLGELQLELNHLVLTGGDGDSKEVTRSVREVMKANKFKRRNREAVECDAAMKQFLYLRNLQSKFAQVENIAKQLCEEVNPPPGIERWSGSSRTMSYSSSSESTIADGEVRSRTKSVSSESNGLEEGDKVRR
ncbi:potassium channel family protein [Sporobolomyces salmoneus]|uniref:potassium channel family protein n=1 Tax=Sporobolomyces salmoneus TaxID=183962 RepID=UPI00317F8147